MNRLADLACLALTDRDARHVLGDAILESGWYEPRALALCLPRVRGAKVWRRWHTVCSRPTAEWVRAVLAALLFGAWPSDREAWPVVRRSKCPPLDTGSLTAILKRQYSQSRINNLVYADNPLFGIIQKRTDRIGSSCVTLKACER